MSRNAWFLVLLGVLLGVPPVSGPLSSQEMDEARIRIVEPADWGSAPTRGLQVRSRRSLRVVGLVSHPSGVGKVLLNGEEAALSQEDDGQARFSGFVRVEEGVDAVEVSAYPMRGEVLTRSFPLVPVSAGQAFEAPDQAWSEAGGGSSGQRWAVIIGVGEYQDPQIPALRFADDDAEALRSFLFSEASGMGGFEADHVRVLLNEDATYRNIRSALFSFLRGATEDDVVLIYFAGHGAPDPGRLQDHYLLAYDTDLSDLPATALLMEDVNDAVRRLYYRHLVVMADACHSGGVGGQTATRSLSLNTVNSAFLNRLETSVGGHVTFTASQVNQLSQEDTRWGGGHGVFTYHFLEGLRGRADEDRDAIVTLGEAMEYVRDQVRRDTRNAQIPTISQTAFDWYLPMSVVLETPVAPPEAEVEAFPAPDQPRRAEAGVPPVNPGRPPVVRDEGVAGTASRPLPRVGVEVDVGVTGEDLNPEVLAGIIGGRIESALREAGFSVSDLSRDPASAEIVLTAEASFADQGEVMGGMRSVGMELAMSARERGNPKVLSSSIHTANGAGLSMAAAARAGLDRVVGLGAEAIATDLMTQWEGEGTTPFSVLLSVSGLSGYGDVLWLKENLGNQVPQSAGIVERSADLTAGTAELEWFSPLTSDELAQALEEGHFEEVELEILRVLPGRIEIRVRARE